MDFTDIAAGFDVGKDFFQISDADGKRMHFAQSFVDGIKSFTDEFERFVEMFFHGRLQFFVHGLFHFFEFFGVLVADIFQLFIDQFPVAGELTGCFLLKEADFFIEHPGQLGSFFLAPVGVVEQ